MVSEAWGVVVPVKRLALAKTRLGAYGEQRREALALAFAADVVVAALASPVVSRVLVVTDDPVAAELLGSLGAQVTPDDPDAGLNPALEHGGDLLRAGHPERGVATLSADLPALRAPDLTAALLRVVGRAFVPDRDGTGTTLLAAAAGHALGAAYGNRSHDAHLASGADVLVAAESLRLDVDTPEDLSAAAALGVGPHTARCLAELW